jgi:trk system potassium uptake protein TrkH
VTVSLPRPRSPSRGLASPLSVPFGFLLLIALGTLLLLLPASNQQDGFTPLLTALFTAASAVTVTGLVVVESATYWSPLGQAVLWVLILVGGMGWLTLAGFLLVILGQRITLPQRLALREPLGTAQIGEVIRLVRNTMLSFMAFQMVGAVLLTLHFHDLFTWSWPKALGQGLFHAVSGFTNAGFTILPDSVSLSLFSGDLTVLTVMGLLILLGGLSFPVMADMLRLRRFSRFSLDTKIVLVGSVALWLLGALVIFAFESSEPRTLGLIGVLDQVVNAAFHSISARSGGFSTVDVGAMVPATAFFVTGLMFVGSASASVGGGIRLNTLGVLVATVSAALRGRRNITLFRREVAQDQVHRAIAVVTVAGAFVFLLAFVLTFTESHQEFIDLFFEVVSAIGTVGLSRGVTPELTAVGKLLIISAMALGRMGPLMLALALAQREQAVPLYRNPRERVKIG